MGFMNSKELQELEAATGKIWIEGEQFHIWIEDPIAFIKFRRLMRRRHLFKGFSDDPAVISSCVAFMTSGKYISKVMSSLDCDVQLHQYEVGERVATAKECASLFNDDEDYSFDIQSEYENYF